MMAEECWSLVFQRAIVSEFFVLVNEKKPAPVHLFSSLLPSIEIINFLLIKLYVTYDVPIYFRYSNYIWPAAIGSYGFCLWENRPNIPDHALRTDRPFEPQFLLGGQIRNVCQIDFFLPSDFKR